MTVWNVRIVAEIRQYVRPESVRRVMQEEVKHNTGYCCCRGPTVEDESADKGMTMGTG